MPGCQLELLDFRSSFFKNFLEKDKEKMEKVECFFTHAEGLAL
jgi:hypothetical protein